MSSIDALILRVPVRSLTLIDLDLPLTALVGITKKRKQILTCTQEITRAKLEQLRSTRLIHGDQQITIRHAKALIKTKELISLLATRLSTIKPVN
jgi:tRNA A37 threonylcarbamoyladenosine dehydratase